MVVRRWDVPVWISAIALVAVAVFLYVIRGILPPFVAALVLAYMLSPVVSVLEGYFRLSRTGAVLLLYLIAMSPISALWFWVLPPLVYETQGLAADLPGITAKVLTMIFGAAVLPLPGLPVPAADVAAWATGTARALLGVPSESALVPRAAFGLFLNILLGAVALAYMLIDGGRLARASLGIFSSSWRAQVHALATRVDGGLSPYLWGMLVQTGMALAITWLAFGALYRLPYALAVATATVLLGLIPFVGPFAAVAFATAVGLAVGSVELGVGVLVFYVLYRLFEQRLLGPRLLNANYTPRAAVAMFAVLAGGAAAGLLGALLALPIAIAGKAVAVHWQAAGSEATAETSAAELALDAR